MSWRYEQRTGRLLHDDIQIGIGYSGAGQGKNNPSAQDIKCVGPIPRGTYTIGAPVDTMTHGPYVLRLTPDPDNNMCGRSGFLMHGDSVVEPGTASEGCIIQSRAVRERVWESGDRVLNVI